MGAFAALLVGLGIVGFIIALMQKRKSGRIAGTPFVSTGEVVQKGDSVVGPKGAVSVQGQVICQNPLISPVTQTPCLYYEVTVVGKWKEGDSTKNKTYVEEKQAAAFSLDDGTGPVSIVAPKGGDFEPFDKSFEETRKEGFFDDLKAAFGKGKPMPFGHYEFHNPIGSKASEFTCTERVFKIHPQLYALGKQIGRAHV